MNRLSKLTLGLAVAIVIAVGFFVVYKNKLNLTPGNNRPAEMVFKPDNAPKGQIVSGFPQEFLLDSGASLSQSYSFNNGSGAIQYTTVLTTSKSPEDEYKLYLDYLNKKGWAVISKNLSADKTRADIHALDVLKDFSLTVLHAKGDSSTTLSLTYVKEPKQ